MALSDQTTQISINPAALTAAQAAALLDVDVATVREHVRFGLPTQASGTINFAEYVAWLAVEVDGRPGEK